MTLEMMNADDEQDIENAEGGEFDGAEGFDDEDEGGLNLKLILIIAVPVVLLLAGSGLYFTGMLDSVLGKAECVEEVDDHGEVISECPEEMEKDGHGDGHDDEHGDGHGDGHASFLEIPTMIVNLNTENGTPRYLRLSVQLEMESAADMVAVEGVIPRVVDQFQTYLRELRVRDLRGSAGIYRLETELLWRVNQAAAPVEIKNVLFQEILVQ